MHLHSEMQVRTAGAAGDAGQGDLLADFHTPPWLQVDAALGKIGASGHAVVVVQHAQVIGLAAKGLGIKTRLEVVLREVDNYSGTHGQCRRSLRNGEIDGVTRMRFIVRATAEALRQVRGDTRGKRPGINRAAVVLRRRIAMTTEQSKPASPTCSRSVPVTDAASWRSSGSMARPSGTSRSTRAQYAPTAATITVTGACRRLRNRNATEH